MYICCFSSQVKVKFLIANAPYNGSRHFYEAAIHNRAHPVRKVPRYPDCDRWRGNVILMKKKWTGHYSDVIIGAIASQITSLTTVYSTVYSRRRSKKTSKLRGTGLCAGNSPVTGEFPAQRASNAENVSIWWRHHGIAILTAPGAVIDKNFAKITFPFQWLAISVIEH